MNIRQIVAEIDGQIARLGQVRKLLSPALGGKRRGQSPMHSEETRFNLAEFADPPKKRRTMTAEGRARIVAAQRKRWAKQKRSA